MRSLRVLVIAIIAATLVIGLMLDGGERPDSGLAGRERSAVPEVYRESGTWFCPGGSAPGGVAEVGIELANASDAAAVAVVAGIRNGTGPEAGETEITIPAFARVTLALADLVSESEWMGAVVEVDSADVIVEQTFVGPTGTDRAPCHTRTSTDWVVAAGATRRASHGEELFVLVLNPFQDDAVVNVSFDADVGVDSLDGVVIPARRVVAIDVTAEVTVASRVSAVIDVVSGRVAAARIQVFDGEEIAGLAVTPATPRVGPVWYLVTVHGGDRRDVISVTNPSPDETAEVDLEIITGGDVRLDPIELTVRPGRTVVVPISEETRLEGLTEFSIIARSLTGVPVAVTHESAVPLGGAEIASVAATIGADVATDRWLAPFEFDSGSIVILNPSATSIVIAEVWAIDAEGRRLVAEVEIGPGRRATLGATDIGGDRPVVEVIASAPVVVARDLVGVSSRRMAPGIVAAEPVTVGQ